MRFARGSAMLALVLLASCHRYPPPCRADPRYDLGRGDDAHRGVPETVFGTAHLVADTDDRDRRCQVVIEPAFAVAHAVWLTQPPDGDARIVVSVDTRRTLSSRDAKDSARDRYFAELDDRTAWTADRLCRRFLARRPKCEHLGLDGTYYHVAHHIPRRSYSMRTFWSPSPGSSEDRFVALVEALRDYVVSPDSLRSAQWWKIQRAAGELEHALETDDAR